MMRILKKVLLLISILILLIILSAGLLVNLYGDEIKNLIVENLNKGLKTEVEVQEVDFSIWDNFPMASVVFKDVVIHAVDAKNDTLLAAEKISAQFSLLDLYREDYRLIALDISDGVCRMQVDNSGNENYIFWNEESNDSSSFSTELQKVSIENIQYLYLDYSKDIEVVFKITDADLKGNFSNSLFDLSITTALDQANIRIKEMNLFEYRALDIDVEGQVNKKRQLLDFKKAFLSVDEMTFNILGVYQYSGQDNIDIAVTAEQLHLAKAITLLPKTVKEKLQRFSIDGRASFDGKISGKILKPAYGFNFLVQNGHLKDAKSDLSFQNSFIDGSIGNGEQKELSSTTLEIKQFSSTLSQGQIEGYLKVQDFTKPQYEYEGKLKFQLSELVDLLKWEHLTDISGGFETETSIKGTLKDRDSISIDDWKNATVTGEMKLINLGFRLQDYAQPFSNLEGDFSFNNNSIAIHQLKGNIGNTSLDIKGKFNNLIGFLLEKEEPLFVDAALHSPKIVLSELMAQEKGDDAEKYQLEVSPRITIYLETKIDALEFNRFKAENISSMIVVKNKRIDARGLKFNSQKGNIQGDFFIKENDNEQLTFFSEVALRRVDINQLFYSFNDFGQATLQQEHVSGIADADIRFKSDWSKDLKVIQESIQADIDLIIDNGMLSNFKPLESLSKFVELEELQQIKFKQLRNQILIKDRIITIPKFDILSSAMDLSIEGTHTFDNEIDYHFTLLLNELLGKKAKKPNHSDFGYVEDDGLGRTQLFLEMTGTVENPKIKYDSKEWKNNIKEQMEEEKQVFKSILKEEFGLFKKDTSVKAIPIERKQSPFQVEIDSTYINKKHKGSKKGKEDEEKQEEKGDKSKFGKFLDKIAKPNEEEYVDPIDEK